MERGGFDWGRRESGERSVLGDSPLLAKGERDQGEERRKKEGKEKLILLLGKRLQLGLKEKKRLRIHYRGANEGEGKKRWR